MGLILVSIALLAACAGPPKPQELLWARMTYERASGNPAVADNAPVALYQAGQAVVVAERAFEAEADADVVLHLAGIAAKRIEIAEAVAESKATEREVVQLRRALIGIREDAKSREIQNALAEAAEARSQVNSLLSLATRSPLGTTNFVDRLEGEHALRAREVEALKEQKHELELRAAQETAERRAFELQKAQEAAELKVLEFQRAYAAAEARAAQLEAANAAAEEKLRAVEVARTSSETKASELEEVNEVLRETSKTAITRGADLEEAQRAAAEREVELSTARENAEQAASNLDRAKEEAEARADDLERHSEKSNERIEELESANQGLRSDIRELLSGAKSLFKSEEPVEATVSEAQIRRIEEGATAEATRALQDSRSQELEYAAESAERRVREVQGAIDSSERRVSEMRAQVEASESELRELRDTAAAERRRSQELEASESEAISKVQELEGATLAAKKQLEELQVAHATEREVKRAAQGDAERSAARVRDLASERTLLAEYEARITPRGVVFTFSDLFGSNSAVVRDAAAGKLGRLVEYLNGQSERGIVIEGHTDAIGNEKYNQSLSERRAAAVGEFLRQRGIRADRVSTRGFGESTPIAPNSTLVGREKNRRIELILVKATAS